MGVKQQSLSGINNSTWTKVSYELYPLVLTTARDMRNFSFLCNCYRLVKGFNEVWGLKNFERTFYFPKKYEYFVFLAVQFLFQFLACVNSMV